MLLAAAAVLINAAAQARAAVRGGADVSLRRARPCATLLPTGALLVAGPGDGPGAGDEADDRRRRRRDGGRRALDRAARDARRKALLLFLGGVATTAGFWFIRNLIHSGNPLPVAQRARPDRPARARPGARGPRQLHRRPLHLRRRPTATSGASTSTWRSPTCSGPAWFAVPRRRRGRGGAGHRAPPHPGRPAARRGHRGRRRSPTCSRR